MRTNQPKTSVVLGIVACAATCLLACGALSDEPTARKGDPRKSADEAVKDADDRLAAILRDWEEKRNRIRDIRCQFELTISDPVFQSTTTDYGEVTGSKPNLVRIDLKDEKGRPTSIVLLKEMALHDYDFQKKAALVWRLPKGWDKPWKKDQELGFWEGMMRDMLERMLYVCFGLAPETLKERFTIHLVKEDADWLWLNLEPRTRGDRLSIRWLQLVLDKKSYIAWHTRLIEPGGRQVSLVLNHADTNLSPPVSSDSLTKSLPQGWKQITYPDDVERVEEESPKMKKPR